MYALSETFEICVEAVLAGGRRSTNSGCRRGGGRLVYTGSMAGGNTNCYKSCGVFVYAASGISALTGVMLTVFGSTSFFHTTERNNMFIIIGVASLVLAVVLIGLGFCLNRQAPAEQVFLSPRIPQGDMGFEDDSKHQSLVT